MKLPTKIWKQPYTGKEKYQPSHLMAYHPPLNKNIKKLNLFYIKIEIKLLEI